MDCDSIDSASNNSNAFFSYIFPVITLILGALIDRMFNFFVERKRIKISGEQWIGEINYFIKPIESQIFNITTFLEEHNKDEFKTPQFTLMASLNGEVFKSLSKPDFFRFIKRKFKDQKESIELASKIHTAIDIATSNYTRIEKIFNQYLENTSFENNEFSNNLNKLMRGISEIGVGLERAGTDPNDDPMFVEIYHLQDKFMPRENIFNIELFEFHNNFIIGMITILTKYKTDERTKLLSEYLHYCSRSILKIKAEKTYLSENMTKVIKSLEYAKDKLMESLDEINN